MKTALMNRGLCSEECKDTALYRIGATMLNCIPVCVDITGVSVTDGAEQ